jgi:hypothetical protein
MSTVSRIVSVNYNMRSILLSGTCLAMEQPSAVFLSELNLI